MVARCLVEECLNILLAVTWEHTKIIENLGRNYHSKVLVLPPGAWIFVCCECRVLTGRGLCDELITHPEESYRLCCVVVCDLETSRMGAPYIYDISRLRVKYNLLQKNLRRGTCPALPTNKYMVLAFIYTK